MICLLILCSALPITLIFAFKVQKLFIHSIFILININIASIELLLVPRILYILFGFWYFVPTVLSPTLTPISTFNSANFYSFFQVSINISYPRGFSGPLVFGYLFYVTTTSSHITLYFVHVTLINVSLLKRIQNS